MKVKLTDDVLVNIYELRDPRDSTKSPRYVGITIKDLDKRLLGHLSSLKSKTYKNNWVKSLLKDGVCPTIHLIEEVIGWDYACKVEQYWIKEFKEQGYILTNSTDGGEGSLGLIPRPETIEKCRQASLGKNNSMYGLSGELSPAWGRHHSDKDKDNIRKGLREAYKNIETPEGSGLSYSKQRDNWVTIIWIEGTKIQLGTYKDKEYAIQVRKEALDIKYGGTQPCLEGLRKIINKHTRIEWCKKLKERKPEIKFWVERNKFITRMSTNPGRKHIGIFETKDEAIKAWYAEVERVTIPYLLNK